MRHCVDVVTNKMLSPAGQGRRLQRHPVNLQETAKRRGQQGHLWPPRGEGQGTGELHVPCPARGTPQSSTGKATGRRQHPPLKGSSREGRAEAPLPAGKNEALLVLSADAP